MYSIVELPKPRPGQDVDADQRETEEANIRSVPGPSGVLASAVQCEDA